MGGCFGSDSPPPEPATTSSRARTPPSTPSTTAATPGSATKTSEADDRAALSSMFGSSRNSSTGERSPLLSSGGSHPPPKAHTVAHVGRSSNRAAPPRETQSSARLRNERSDMGGYLASLFPEQVIAADAEAATRKSQLRSEKSRPGSGKAPRRNAALASAAREGTMEGNMYIGNDNL